MKTPKHKNETKKVNQGNGRNLFKGNVALNLQQKQYGIQSNATAGDED